MGSFLEVAAQLSNAASDGQNTILLIDARSKIAFAFNKSSCIEVSCEKTVETHIQAQVDILPSERSDRAVAV
jgi:hypothetical protein